MSDHERNSWGSRTSKWTNRGRKPAFRPLLDENPRGQSLDNHFSTRAQVDIPESHAGINFISICDITRKLNIHYFFRYKKNEIQIILRDLAPDSAFNPIDAWETEKARRADEDVIGTRSGTCLVFRLSHEALSGYWWTCWGGWWHW
jgi:hypothetical protein